MQHFTYISTYILMMIFNVYYNDRNVYKEESRSSIHKTWFSRNWCVRVTPITASTLSTSAYTKFWLITTGTVILYYGAAESH